MKIETINLFKKELVDLSVTSYSVDDFFYKKSSELFKFKFVGPNFCNAITNREKEFPTGLALDRITLAIPHTDVIHVKEPFVSINRLTEPLDFIQMGTDDVKVKVKDILILGIKDPKSQVGLLSMLMQLFSNAEFVDSYKRISDSEELLTLIKENIGRE